MRGKGASLTASANCRKKTAAAAMDWVEVVNFILTEVEVLREG